jgi:surface polysaccharide O-acyltransferase-like enzyme
VVVFVVIATLLFRLYQSDLYNALSGQISAAWLAPAFVYLNILYAWTCILLLLGLAQRYLNTDSPLLRYLTGAVFCYYVVHQTLIVVAGYYLTQLRLGAINEFLLLTAITIVGCVLSFELLRRVPIVRVFFGIQKPSGIPKAKTNIIEAAR